MNVVSFHQQDRSQGKRARTRARLMDAAVGVIAEKGIEAASINEITIEADVANGTFYNHFADKKELVSAIAIRIAGEIADQIDNAMTNIEDGAQRVSFGTRQFVELAASHPNWGWALLGSIDYLPTIKENLAIHLRQDIQRGIDQGLFKVVHNDFLIAVLMGMLAGTIRARLLGNVDDSASRELAEYQLRVLGVGHQKAKDVANLELKALTLLPPMP